MWALILIEQNYSISFLLGGAIIYWQWEAMVTSYLSARTIVLPFKDLPGLLKTDFKIAATPGKTGNQPPWLQALWGFRQ